MVGVFLSSNFIIIIDMAADFLYHMFDEKTSNRKCVLMKKDRPKLIEVILTILEMIFELLFHWPY